MSTARIIGRSIGVAITAAILITAVAWGWRMRPTDAPCVALKYLITDRNERMYLTEDELNTMLRAGDIYPVGRQQNRVSLHRIEQTVRSHPMVRTAECYLTPRQEVVVRLTQRIPLLRVQMPGDPYFIDTDRRVMQARAAVTDSVLLVTGAVGVQAASGQLADFAEWLQDEPYWQQRIRYVQVKSPHMVYLYLKGDNTPRVVIGSLFGYERKLAKLRTFFENSAEATQDKNYYELDVRFRGQVIGRTL